jgi:dienelactone hydrolase
MNCRSPIAFLCRLKALAVLLALASLSLASLGLASLGLASLGLPSLGLASLAMAAEPSNHRVLPPGKLPDDQRLGPLKNLNGKFPFTPPATVADWQQRSEHLRRQAQVGLGLWPMPSKTPANAVIHGRVDRDEYTVERVYLESFPGHFVTGSLYRPKGKSGKLPGVLCPHGHWPNGRFYDQTSTLRQQIVQGAERFEVGGRSPLQSRCVQLARMGCVVFHYDMVGYADSVQLAHRPGARPKMNTLQDWGFQSPQADLHLQSIMGLQTYNSIRALDWLCSLPDVDAKRIGVTGASGGGTQTFILGAVDPRPAVLFPAVMVSADMQGGCTCENACYLRIGTGNVELAGLFAPKPLGMSAANDWTKDIATRGLPQLERLYALLGAPSHVMAKPLVQFPHNYNYVSRGVMYSWFNKHLRLGFKDPIVEADYEPLSIAEMTVWDEKHPQPPSGDDYERSLLRWITSDSERQLAALAPRDARSLEKYRESIGGAIDILIGRKLPPPSDIEYEKIEELDRGAYLEFGSLLRNTRRQEELPVVFLLPKKWSKQVVIWADERGKQVLFDHGGQPRKEVRQLLADGHAVVGVDLIGQGEFTADGKGWSKAPLNHGGSGTATWGDYAGYTFGYNYPLYSQRVHDLLTVVSFVRNHERKPAAVSIFGQGQAAAWVAAARAQAGAAIDRAAIDTGGFRFAEINALDDPNYLPGVLKYGDLPALVSLSAPHPIWVAGEGSTAPELVEAAYHAAGAAKRLVISPAPQDSRLADALHWLVD